MGAPIGNKFAIGNKGGRPSKYNDFTTEEWENKINEYLEGCVDVIDNETKINKVNLPKEEGLALHLGLYVHTLHEWAELHNEFSQALQIVKELQKNKLMDSGLAGTYNPTIAKLLLSANHGMAEKVDKNINANLNISNSSQIIGEIETSNRRALEGQSLALEQPVQDSEQAGEIGNIPPKPNTAEIIE